MIAAAGAPPQLKPNVTWVGVCVAVAVSAIKKLCDAFAPIETGVLGVPVSALVLGLVVYRGSSPAPA